jgi:hypothetical protein
MVVKVKAGPNRPLHRHPPCSPIGGAYICDMYSRACVSPATSSCDIGAGVGAFVSPSGRTSTWELTGRCRQMGEWEVLRRRSTATCAGR